MISDMTLRTRRKVAKGIEPLGLGAALDRATTA
jgi:hypothetical protein